MPEFENSGEDVSIDIAEVFRASRMETQRFALYVPDVDKEGNKVDQDEWVNRAISLLTEIGGGSTAMPPIRGSWKNEETGQLIEEHPIVVYSFIRPDDFEEHLEELAALVREMGRETNQGEIAFEFDGAFYLTDDFSA